MKQLIPLVCSPLIHDYRIQLRTLLGTNLTGIYLDGSIALGAFDEETSDIDFVTITDRALTQDEVQAVRRLHVRLRQDQWGRRMEGIYVHRTMLAVADNSRFPYVQHGRLRSEEHRLPVVARALLHEQGVVVDGPAAQELFPAVSSRQLRDEMLFNLNVYWTGRLRRPWLFFAGTMVDFAITTLPRIIHTLEYGTIISKQQGITLLRDRFSEWSMLADEIASRRTPGRMAVAKRLVRAYRVMLFVGAMIRYGNALCSSTLPPSGC